MKDEEKAGFTHGFLKRMHRKWGLWWMFSAIAVVMTIVFALSSLIDKCSAGLILSMVGVVITFMFALPEPNNVCYGAFEPEDGTEVEDEGEKIWYEEQKRRIIARKALRKAWAGLGLAFLLLGLSFQLWFQLICQK